MRSARVVMTMIAGAVWNLGAVTVSGQQQPPIRQVGRLERVTHDSLASALNAIPLSDGRVLVNDPRGRRLLLFDSTLASPHVVADTTSAAANAYGRQGGTLIRYHGDTAMFIDVSSLSMLVIGPTGTIARVMAVPHPDEAQQLLGDAFGLPGFDARGRLVYHAANGMEGNLVACCVEHPGHFPLSEVKNGFRDVPKPDSGLLVAVDLANRATDTLARIKVSVQKQGFRVDDRGYVISIERVPVPLPVVDSWAVMADGSVAIVRGSDFHRDVLGPEGHWAALPKIPFAWSHLDDARKTALIDSAVHDEQLVVDHMNGPVSATGSGSGRGAVGRGGGAGARVGTPIPSMVMRPDPTDVPDYVPAFAEHAASADAEDHVWVLTSAIVDGRPVYDVIDRHGALVDRVQLPAFRTIAGFGPGVIYMAVKDARGVVHLERARIH